MTVIKSNMRKKYRVKSQEASSMGFKILLLFFLQLELQQEFNAVYFMFSCILIQNRKNTRLCEQNKNLQYLRMFKRRLLLALIWILKWLKFSCSSFDLNRSPGVHPGRLVHGRWSDNTLQCNHWWAFSGVGVSATELWRLWQTPSGLADRSIWPFQGTGILVCTCESWVKFILSTWKTIRNIIIYRWLANDQSS